MEDTFKELYQKAKKGQSHVVVIEGVHAFKHAVRFGAEIIDAVTADKAVAVDLMRQIATDADVFAVKECVREIDQKSFDDIASTSLRTGIVAIATKPKYVVADAHDKQIIFVENPHDINNVGAVVRVAAGYGAGAVAVSGEISPWHMLAIRAGAGLQWAIPILHVDSIDDVAHGRVIYACDANGKDMRTYHMNAKSVLVFGTEREGISDDLKSRADEIISIPMQDGVSSLNLATSVSAVLYGGLFVEKTSNFLTMGNFDV